ncbi:MAG: 50S ribosomal protein L11 methyltransferase [Phascolarctobacterium sp.]|nr:50S ribosomal protein L11 methyltransferase [Phascolarctobacterium sp.]
MRWIEVKIRVYREEMEAVSDILIAAGAQGVSVEDPELVNDLRSSIPRELCGISEQKDNGTVAVTAYYEDGEKLPEQLEQIRKELYLVEKRTGRAYVGIYFQKLFEKDWANEWKRYFHVTHVGEKIVIKPSWEEYAPQVGECVIEIDPGMSFGTGTHSTTCMCITRLEKILPQHATVFDVGTGSGILAITAAMLGAESVLAADIDPLAVRIAKDNVKMNGLDGKIDVFHSDLLQSVKGLADVIIGNIIADVIIELLQDVPKKLKPNGIFLASGIIKDRQEDITAAAEAVGMKVDYMEENGDWLMMQMGMR